MAEAFTGEIRAFGFNFAPRSWAMCNGQLLPITQNEALFSLLGTFYGGDGRTNFQLPDLRSRAPLHAGQGPGLSGYTIGQFGGVETVTLNQSQMPSHSHTPNASGFTVTFPASTADSTTATPGPTVRLGKAAGEPGEPVPNIYTTGAADTELGQFPATGNLTIDNTGGSQAHENRMPFLAINYCICLFGLFPSRN